MKFEWLQSNTEKFTLLIKYITAFIFIFPLTSPYLVNKRWNMFDIPTQTTALTLTFLFGLLGSMILDRMFSSQMISSESVIKLILLGGLFILTNIFSDSMKENNWKKMAIFK